MSAGPSAARRSVAATGRESLKTRLASLGAGERVLLGLLLAGVALRLVAMLAYWPTIPSNPDSRPYAFYAAHDLLGDPEHPAGYSMFLWALGLITRQVAVLTLLQHALGVLSGLAIFAAVRRLVGSPWPALVGAAFVWLNADQIYTEQYVGSECVFTALIAFGLYTTVRVMNVSSAWVPWAAAAGVAGALAVIVRTQGLFVIAAFALSVLVASPRPWEWRRALALLGVAATLVVGYGVAKQADIGRFEIGPSAGWQLYARVAPFANCRLFTPPAGTRGLCESIPPSQRAGHDHYLYDGGSPAILLFHHIGNQDGKVGSWALAVIEHQPLDYLASVWGIVRDYYVPSSYTPVRRGGYDIDADLDWNVRIGPLTGVTRAQIQHFFFAHFRVHKRPSLLGALHAYQRVFRFGATLLAITTLLVLIGLFVGSRRQRLGVLLFGMAGLLNLLPQALSAAYIGRYSVPMSGPMGAAAAIAALALVARRRGVAAEP